MSLRDVIRRAVLVATTEAVAGLQRVRAMAGDDLDDDVEHAEPYGLATRPPVGAHVLIGCLGGDPSAPVVLQVSDGTYRPTGLTVGDVALYDATGKRITLSATGIQLGAAASLGVARQTDTVSVTIPTGSLGTVAGSPFPVAPVVVTGTITSASTTVKAA